MRISDWSSDVCSSDLLGVSHLLIRTGITKRQQQYAALRQSARHLDRCGAHGPIVLERANTSPVGREQKHQRILRHTYSPACLGPISGLEKLQVDAIGNHLPLDHRSEEHKSELQSLMRISYDVFCLKKKTTN